LFHVETVGIVIETSETLTFQKIIAVAITIVISSAMKTI